MMLLLTLLNTNIRYEVEKVIIQCSFSALSIFLFPVEIFKSIPLYKQLYTVKPDQHLSNLKATTGSTLINCIFLVLVLIILAIVYLLVHKFCKGGRTETIKKYILKAYPRILMETFIFVMIASMLEFKHFNEDGSILSLFFTKLIFLLETMFICIVLRSWMNYSKVQEIDEDSCSSELYSGIITVSQQQNQANEPQRNAGVPFQIKMTRLYASIFLIRRLLMVFIFVIPSESYIGYKA